MEVIMNNRSFFYVLSACIACIVIICASVVTSPHNAMTLPQNIAVYTVVGEEKALVYAEQRTPEMSGLRSWFFLERHMEREIQEPTSLGEGFVLLPEKYLLNERNMKVYKASFTEKGEIIYLSLVAPPIEKSLIEKYK
ncbi:MAG: hypothetical protein PHG49_00355 [Candidatus Pacebacteria bacterium]|nr:hypothetical protein [Candidatus Paceibacterota bacterium]